MLSGQCGEYVGRLIETDAESQCRGDLSDQISPMWFEFDTKANVVFWYGGYLPIGVRKGVQCEV